MVVTHPRTIKSYIKRDSRITPGQHFALHNFWEQFGLEPEKGRIDFVQVFGRAAPTILEIGFGMGHALLSMATAMPESDFIGIEVHRPGVGSVLSGIKKEGLKNIRVFNQDAVAILEQCVPEQSLDKILIFFPDPWPKKRHHKRRLIQSQFVRLLCSRLKVHGKVHLATDWQEYALQMMEVISSFPDFINEAGKGQFSERPSYRPLTKFEKRAQELGHDVWDLIFEKIL